MPLSLLSKSPRALREEHILPVSDILNMFSMKSFVVGLTEKEEKKYFKKAVTSRQLSSKRSSSKEQTSSFQMSEHLKYLYGEHKESSKVWVILALNGIKQILCNRKKISLPDNPSSEAFSLLGPKFFQENAPLYENTVEDLQDLVKFCDIFKISWDIAGTDEAFQNEEFKNFYYRVCYTLFAAVPFAQSETESPQLKTFDNPTLKIQELIERLAQNTPLTQQEVEEIRPIIRFLYSQIEKTKILDRYQLDPVGQEFWLGGVEFSEIEDEQEESEQTEQAETLETEDPQPETSEVQAEADSDENIAQSTESSDNGEAAEESIAQGVQPADERSDLSQEQPNTAETLDSPIEPQESFEAEDDKLGDSSTGQPTTAADAQSDNSVEETTETQPPISKTQEVDSDNRNQNLFADLIEKREIDPFFDSLRSVKNDMEELLGSQKTSKEIEIKRTEEPDNRSGILFTGFLNVTSTAGGKTFYNFYPKFRWENNVPVPISVEEALHLFPDFGSFLLEKDPADRSRGASHNYSFLKEGVLLNVRLDSLQDLNNLDEAISSKLANRKFIYLNRLVSQGNICLSEDAPQDYRCFYVSSTTQEVDPEYLDNTPVNLTSEDQKFYCETKRANSIIYDKGEYFGPYRLDKRPDLMFMGRRDNGLPDYTVRRWQPYSPSAIQSISQKSPEKPAVHYQVIFTGPKFCKEYVSDRIRTDSQLTTFLSHFFSNNKTDVSLEGRINQLSKLKFDNQQLYPILFNRIQKALSFEKISDLKESLKYTLTYLMANAWADAVKKNSKHAEEFFRIMTSSIEGNKVLEASHEVSKKIEEKIEQKKTKLSDIQQDISKKQKECSEKKREVAKLEKEVASKREELSIFESISSLRRELNDGDKHKQEISDQISELQKEKQAQEASLSDFNVRMQAYSETIDNIKAKAAELIVDEEVKTLLKSQLGVSAPAQAPVVAPIQQEVKEGDTTEITDKQRLEVISSIPTRKKSSETLISELLTDIRSSRKYDNNDVIAVLASIATGFLTVFAGSPGSGKTSFCDLLGAVFGLNSVCELPQVKKVWADKSDLVNRYLMVPVERGWMSKRDFIGYYNPLTDTFECGDPQRYELLKTLDLEERNNLTDLPYIVLLDEANLSQMEFYFADFMNIGERKKGQDNFVALGDRHRYKIGKNLRFLATINSDHTTEKLSPRLIDRSWIIKLPEVAIGADLLDSDILATSKNPVNWTQFTDAFDVGGKHNYSESVRKTLEEICRIFYKMQIRISFRSCRAVLDFVAGSSRWMTSVRGSKETIALDYAVNQRLLPQISVYGSEMFTYLTELENYLDKKGLRQSAVTVRDILSRGAELQGFSYF